MASFRCWPPWIPHEIETPLLPFQHLFCLSEERLSPAPVSLFVTTVHHRKPTLAKTHACKKLPLNQSKSILLSFSKDTQPFSRIHKQECQIKLPPYLLATAWTFLFPHAAHSVHTLYWRGCEKGKGGCCRYHMFTQFQSQQRSSSLSAVPRRCDNKQTGAACPAETGCSIPAASAESLSSTAQISHAIASCSPSSPLPLKGLFLVSPALSPTPTHHTGAAKAMTKLPGSWGLGADPCADAGRGPPGWGAPALAVKDRKHASSPKKWFTALLLRWLGSLPYTHSADGQQTSSQGQASCHRRWRKAAGRATSPKRRKSGATAAHCNMTGDKWVRTALGEHRQTVL